MTIPLKLKTNRLNIDFEQIHQYAEDLKTMTILRDKCLDTVEKARYTNIIKVMQLVMHHLNNQVEEGTNG